MHWLSGNPFPDWRTELFFDDREGYRMTTQKSDMIEFGLVLPNGQVLWSAYSNRSLATPADRDMMVQVLRKTAEECGFTEEQFLSNYKWVSRRVKTEVTDLGTFTLTDPEIIGVDTPVTGEDDGEYDNSNNSANGAETTDGHGGDLREGSLGGVASGSA
jgi:hypothetical protein